MPTLPNNQPKTVTIGSGADTLKLKVCQDWYPSVNASYTVQVDGVQIGGTQSVSALRANGQWDTVNVKGNWTTASHTCTVNFLNNAGDGYDWQTNHVPADFHDRNMFVYGELINDKIITGANLNLYGVVGEAHSFSFTRAAPVLVPTKTPQNLTVGTGADTLLLHVAQDWYPGANAQYTVLVDNVQIGGTLICQSLRSANQTDTVNVKGNFAAGNHTVTVNFINNAGDGYDWITFGEPANLHDRNMYVSNVTFNGVAVPNSNLNLFGVVGEAHTFSITKAAPVSNYPVALTNAGITDARLTFSDEFDTLDIGPAEAGLKWRSDGDQTAYSVNNGILTLALNGNLRSDGGVPNGFMQKYGYYEGSMQLPQGSGAWPGFYLSGQTGSDYELEIDQMEGGSDPHSYSASYNVWKAPLYGSVPWDQAPWVVDPQGTTWDTAVVTAAADLTTGLHTYGVLWKPGSGGGHDITFYLDNQIVAHQTVAASLGDSGPGDEIVIQNFLQGSGTSDTPLLVDWVRVWQLAGL